MIYAFVVYYTDEDNGIFTPPLYFKNSTGNTMVRNDDNIMKWQLDGHYVKPYWYK